MQTYAHGANMKVPAELQRYAESRLWMAAHRSPRRAGWARALLERDDAGRQVTCQADAWVRELGLVSARGADPDPFRAVDLAGHHLEQALARHVRRAARLPLPPGDQLDSDRESPWRLGERSSHESRPGHGTEDRDRSTHRARTDRCPFLDYDPVIPNWPE